MDTNYENSSIDIKDKIVSEQSHSTNDVTCGGSLENPTHKLSKKIEKSIFQTISMIEPTEASNNFVYRDEDDNIIVSESGKWKTVIADNVSFEHIYSLFENEGEEDD